nr:MAG TPA: endonuclease-like protein [Caudoviricetes sp.]
MIGEKCSSYIFIINLTLFLEEGVKYILVSDQKILTTWMPANRQHYIDKGYHYTKCRDKILVDVKDLPRNSQEEVKVVCDYCGKEFVKRYVNYLRQRSNNKDCCKNCQPKKFAESCMKKFGVCNPFQLDEVKKKSKKTCLERFGVENPAQSEEVKKKTEQTNFERYGNKYAIASDIIKAKREQTCENKYGAKNVFGSKEIQEKIKLTNEKKYGVGNIAHTFAIAEKIKQSNISKYGVPYTTQVPKVQAKIRESLMKNGTVATSKPERAVCGILHEMYGRENCIDGYSLDNCNMDCLVSFAGCKIDVEYDGWYWHRGREEHDKRRNYWLIKQGYKILRIKGNKKDSLPNRQQISEAIDYLVKGNHSLTYIDMNI